MMNDPLTKAKMRELADLDTKVFIPLVKKIEHAIENAQAKELTTTTITHIFTGQSVSLRDLRSSPLFCKTRAEYLKKEKGKVKILILRLYNNCVTIQASW